MSNQPIDLRSVYSPKDIENLDMYFQAFHENKRDDRINIDEVLEAMAEVEDRKFGIITNLLSSVQMQFKSNKITFSQFLDALTDQLNGESGKKPPEEDLQDVFQMFGKTLKQTLNWEDIQEAGLKVGEEYTAKQCKDLVKKMGARDPKTGDYKISV